MNGKLFQSFAGIVRQHGLVNGTAMVADTPFLALGLFMPKDSNQPMFLAMLQGGIVGMVGIHDVRIELTDDMKKALAEVVLTS